MLGMRKEQRVLHGSTTSSGTGAGLAWRIAGSAALVLLGVQGGWILIDEESLRRVPILAVHIVVLIGCVMGSRLWSHVDRPPARAADPAWKAVALSFWIPAVAAMAYHARVTPADWVPGHFAYWSLGIGLALFLPTV